MSGLTGVSYDPGAADRIMLQCNQSVINVIEIERLHVCAHGQARCFNQELPAVGARVVCDTSYHSLAIDQ